MKKKDTTSRVLVHSIAFTLIGLFITVFMHTALFGVLSVPVSEIYSLFASISTFVILSFFFITLLFSFFPLFVPILLISWLINFLSLQKSKIFAKSVILFVSILDVMIIFWHLGHGHELYSAFVGDTSEFIGDILIYYFIPSFFLFSVLPAAIFQLISMKNNTIVSVYLVIFLNVLLFFVPVLFRIFA